MKYLGRKEATLIIMALGLAVRITLLFFFTQIPLFEYELDYHKFAVQILHNESFEPFLPPGLSCWLAFCYRFCGESEFVAKLSMLFFYALLCLFSFLYLKKTANILAANLALAVFAIYPAFVFYSIWPQTHFPIAVLLIIIVYLFDSLQSKTRINALLIGLTAGMLILIRPSGLIYLIVIPLLVLRHLRAKGFTASALVLAGAILPILLWQYKLGEVTKEKVFINSSNAMNFYLGNNEFTPLYRTWWFGSHSSGQDGVSSLFSEREKWLRSIPTSLRTRMYYDLALKHILSRPDLFLLRTINRFRCYFAFDSNFGTIALKRLKLGLPMAAGILGLDALCYCFIFLGAILYLFGQGSSSLAKSQTETILIIALAYAAPYWISFAHPSYHLPIVPLFTVFSAVFGARFIEERSQGTENPPALRKNIKLWIALLLFLYIQLEWFVRLASSFLISGRF